jgi:hypothetical protein
MMLRNIDQVGRLVVLLLFGLLSPGLAAAQVAKDVTIGGTVEVDRADQPITITDPKPTLGAAAVGAEDKQNILVYIAPQRAADGQKATVNYKVGSDAKSAVVTMRELAPTLTDPQFYQASFKAIFVLFILAVLVESGLALIFRWRPFMETFDSRSANAVVAFVFSFVFVQAFNLDITTSLVNVYSGTKYPPGTAGLILTALIIAGGSAGVRQILQTFGYRPPSATEQAPSTPPVDEAWVAVTLLRRNAIGPVTVQIGPPGQIAVAGTIAGNGLRGGLLGYFLRDRGRFPASGGYRLTPGQYEIRVSGTDHNGNALNPPAWGPAHIGNRAIVDVQFTL